MDKIEMWKVSNAHSVGVARHTGNMFRARMVEAGLSRLLRAMARIKC